MLFEVGCGYGLAAAVNDVFDPSGDLQVAVGAPTDEVAAAVKAVWVKAARIVSFGAGISVERLGAPHQ